MAGERADPAGEPPKPLGIGRCGKCAYLNAGTPAICYACARETIEALAPADERCMICDLELPAEGVCGNPICSWALDGRHFEWNYAIAMRSGVLQQAINDFKYNNKWGWKNIFARVLVGFLDTHPETFEGFDLIAASPTFLDPEGSRKYDHTREVIMAANEESDGRWPFDTAEPPVIVKTAATTALVRHSWKERRAIAEGELRASLGIPDVSRVRGKSILVYDDVFTDGFTLREVARCLREDGGAATVCGVSLTRQPWRGAR